MANSNNKGFIDKLLKFILTIICIVAIIAIVVGIQTVATVGNWVSKLNINGFDTTQLSNLTKDSKVPYLGDVTFADLDFDPQEKTVFDLARLVMALSDGLNVDQSEIADDPVQEEHETQVKDKLDQLLPDQGEGEKDYLSILREPIVTATPEQVVYSPNEIGALCNVMIGQASDSTNANLQYLADLNATICQISLQQTDGVKQVKIVLSVDISSMKADITANLPSFIADRLGDTLYITYVGNLTANEGVLTSTSQQLVLNNFDQSQSNLVLSVVGAVAGWSDTNASEYVATTIGEVFDTIINNLGKVGILNGGVANYTMDAIDVENSQIKLITHVE